MSTYLFINLPAGNGCSVDCYFFRLNNFANINVNAIISDRNKLSGALEHIIIVEHEKSKNRRDIKVDNKIAVAVHVGKESHGQMFGKIELKIKNYAYRDRLDIKFDSILSLINNKK